MELFDNILLFAYSLFSHSRRRFVSPKIELSIIDLDSYTKLYGVKIIFDETIFNMIENSSTIVELDRIETPLKTAIYTIVSKPDTDLIVNNHKKFLDAYRNGRVDMAATIAASLRTAWSGELQAYYSLMITRCKHLRANPPKYNWDGVYRK